MKSYWDGIRKFDRDVLIFLGLFCMIGFGYFGINAVLFNLYLLQLGYQPEFIGRLIGMGQLVWGVFALPAGALGLRFGVKKMMFLGFLAIAIGAFLYSVTALIPAAFRDAVLTAGWLLSWMGAAFAVVNSIPYLMALTTDETRSLAFTAQGVIIAVFAFAGSLVGGVLPGLLAASFPLQVDQPTAYMLAMLFVPLCYIICAILISKARDVTLVSQSSENAGPARPPIGILLFFALVVIFQAYGEGTVRSFFNIYLSTALTATTAQVGMLMGFGQLIPILFLMFVPLALKTWKTNTAMFLTTLACSLFILLLAGTPAWGKAAAGFIGVMGTAAMIGIVRGILSQEIVNPRWGSISSAVVTIGMALGWGLSAWLSGSLIQTISFQGIFIFAAGLTLLSAGMIAVQVLVVRLRARRSGALVEITPAD